MMKLSTSEAELVRKRLAQGDDPRSIKLPKHDAGHRPRRSMNRTEERYAANLEAHRHAGHIEEWRFEQIRLKLADGAWFKPDFLLVLPGGRCEFHEVKGFWREAARVRIKVASERFPWFKFLAVHWIKGKWVYEEF